MLKLEFPVIQDTQSQLIQQTQRSVNNRSLPNQGVKLLVRRRPPNPMVDTLDLPPDVSLGSSASELVLLDGVPFSICE
ncbi:hypothetical protein CEXT_300051, partial [Caerostris extrusa]